MSDLSHDISDVTTNQCKATFSNNDDYTLDSIFLRLGQFGRFQLMVFLLICVPMLFNAVSSVTYVFTASTVVHRCNITECDSSSSQFNEPWTEFTIPSKNNGMDNCRQYASKLDKNHTNFKYDKQEFCYPENFDELVVEKCSNDNLIFRDKEVTISNDFGIYCSDIWKLSLVGTVNNIGQFFGIPLGGFISDRFGRCTSLALCGFLSAIFGIMRSFSPTYIHFLVFEFLDNMANSTLYSTCFIIGIELVGPKRRVIACCLITIFYAIGEILLAIFAKYYQDWRVLLRISYIPALVLCTYFWILPESVRWLLSQGKEKRAKQILMRAAAVNKRKLSDHSLDKLLLANRQKLLATTEGKFPIKEAFQFLFFRILNCAFCWIVNVLVYYGLSLNAVLLDGNKYNNFIFIALVEIPGFLMPFITMDRIGRRYSLFGYMMISGLCCFSTIFIGPENNYLELSLFLLGKLSITASFQVLYFFTSEIFPTNVRNSLLSFCSMVGRIGSMIAPQTPLLAKWNAKAPAMLFGIAAVISGCLTLLFPETTNIVLPSTMKEADQIGVKEESNKDQITASPI